MPLLSYRKSEQLVYLKVFLFNNFLNNYLFL